jgi:RNA polymerase sigma factor (sigma-70 family)
MIAKEQARTVLRHIGQLVEAESTKTLSDGELVARFAERGLEAAYAALVKRHGRLVWGVCRNLLGGEHDTEDAFQATFLVLARRAGSIRKADAVASWLYGVAHRVACKARKMARLRKQHEREAASRPTPQVPGELAMRELQATLAEEVDRLPEKYRSAFVLCCLEGKTRQEVSRAFGCREGTISSRIARARRLLAEALGRRGVMLSGALCAHVLWSQSAAAQVPAALLWMTVKAGCGLTPKGASAGVTSLAAAVLRGMTLAKWRLGALLLVTLAVAAVGTGLWVQAGSQAPLERLEGLTEKQSDPEIRQPEEPATRPAATVTLVAGNWTLTEWLAPNAPHQDAILTISHKNGKPTITAVEDDLHQWHPGKMTVAGRRVTFSLTPKGPFDKRFDGLMDPADSTRVLGSLWWQDGRRAERAVLELVPPGARGKPQKVVLPPEWAKYIELARAEGQAVFDAAGPAFQSKPPAEQKVLRAAAQAAQQRSFTEMPKLFRKLVAERPDSPFGYEAAMELIGRTDRLMPAFAEIDAWIKAARTFAATHGPQFEAATVGRAASVLTHQSDRARRGSPDPAAYADAARKYAAEADRLARAAGMPETHAALVAEYDAERAAWARLPKPPPDGSTWTVTLSGRVTDVKGKPVPDALVLVNNMEWVKVLFSDGSHETTTGPDGRYTITLKCQGSHRLHVTQMWAEKSGFVRTVNTDRHKLLPGQSATIDFTVRFGEPFGATLRVRRERWEHELGPKDNTPHLLTVRGPGVTETVVATNGKRFELTLPAGTYTVELDRGRRKLSWPGLKTGRTDHLLEEPPFRFTPETVGAVFDEMWLAMDRNYSFFALKPSVDWAKLRNEYQPRAVKTRSADELAAVLTEMLGRLNDGHVWIEMPDGKMIGTHRTAWTYNGNRKVVLAQLNDVIECGEYAVVGKTKPDGFGYFLMTRQSAATPELVAKAVAAIEKLARAPGFMIDLRSANGGSEPLAQEIARLFCGKKVVYANSRYRNGPEHDDFTEDQPRELPPAKSGKAYLKPVVCLLGPGCVSSGEGFAQMLAALPHVTTVGLPTRGSSGNPGPVEVGETGLSVYFSRWLDLMPDGTPIEGKGIQPAVRVEAPVDRYRDADPTLAKGLEVLRVR